ncbi:MAG: hypothetical protein ABS81_13735 [Pseudonocardia sp. SCN 72-86]|nr:MAG: hypothetical protein ABS81_13735 [Pseudonocardia sp. SCN 72-86]
MSPLHIDHATASAAFLGELDAFVAAVGSVSDHDLLAASRCHGWAVVDVVVHVRTGLQDMLGGAVTPSTSPPDTDAASYWRKDVPSTDDAADTVDGILWTRRTASPIDGPPARVAHLRAAADAVRSAVQRMPDGPVAFHGHVLASGDFLATWAVELAVHHLDVRLGPPTAESLRLGRLTVETLAGAAFPPTWSDAGCLRTGAGRRDPSPAGATLAATMPVLG